MPKDMFFLSGQKKKFLKKSEIINVQVNLQEVMEKWPKFQKIIFFMIEISP